MQISSTQFQGFQTPSNKMRKTNQPQFEGFTDRFKTKKMKFKELKQNIEEVLKSDELSLHSIDIHDLGILIECYNPYQWGKIIEFLKPGKDFNRDRTSLTYRGLPLYFFQERRPKTIALSWAPGSSKDYTEKTGYLRTLTKQLQELDVRPLLHQGYGRLKQPHAYAIAIACKDEADREKAESLLTKTSGDTIYPYRYEGLPVGIYMIGSKHP